MEPTATTTSPAEPLAVPAARRLPRIRLRQLVLPLLVLVAVGVLGGVAVGLRHQTEATNAQLVGVRGQLHRASHELAAARAALATTESQSAAVQSSLTTATRQLQALQGQLSKVELSEFLGGVNIGAVQICLGGVQVALNELGLGDAGGAVASLKPVAGSCQIALGGS